MNKEFTKKIQLRLTQEQEDRLLIHAAKRRIKTPTTVATMLFEDGLELADLGVDIADVRAWKNGL